MLAISAPTPNLVLASWTISALSVLVTEHKTVSLSIGTIVCMIGAYVSEVRRDIKEMSDFFVATKVLGAKDGPVTAHQALEVLRLPQVEDIVAAAKEMAR